MKNLNKFYHTFKICDYSKKLLKKISLINATSKNKVNILEVYKAICYAKKYHFKQKRESGEPYYYHPLEVACMAIDQKFNTDLIITSILHDTIEDTECTKKNIKSAFGFNIASQVEDLSKIKSNSLIKISSREMVKILLSEKKYDLLLIKYFDRLHNMQNIKIKSVNKRKKITYETLDIFLNLGEYLSIDVLIQNQLLELCTQNA